MKMVSIITTNYSCNILRLYDLILSNNYQIYRYRDVLQVFGASLIFEDFTMFWAPRKPGERSHK